MNALIISLPAAFVGTTAFASVVMLRKPRLEEQAPARQQMEMLPLELASGTEDDMQGHEQQQHPVQIQKVKRGSLWSGAVHAVKTFRRGPREPQAEVTFEDMRPERSLEREDSTDLQGHRFEGQEVVELPEQVARVEYDGHVLVVQPPNEQAPDADALHHVDQAEIEQRRAALDRDREEAAAVQRAAQAREEAARAEAERVECERIAAEAEGTERGRAWTALWYVRLDPDATDVAVRKRIAASLGCVREPWAGKLLRIALEQEEDAAVRARLIGSMARGEHFDDPTPFQSAHARGGVEAIAVLEALEPHQGRAEWIGALLADQALV